MASFGNRGTANLQNVGVNSYPETAAAVVAIAPLISDLNTFCKARLPDAYAMFIGMVVQQELCQGIDQEVSLWVVQVLVQVLQCIK